MTKSDHKRTHEKCSYRLLCSIYTTCSHFALSDIMLLKSLSIIAGKFLHFLSCTAFFLSTLTLTFQSNLGFEWVILKASIFLSGFASGFWNVM